MKSLFIFILMICSILVLKGQTIHYIIYGNGISYSKLNFITDFTSGDNAAKGFDYGLHAGLGISSLRSSVLGGEILYSRIALMGRSKSSSNNYSRVQSKLSYKLFTRFDFYERYSFKPFISLNQYKNADYSINNKAYRMEYGASIISKGNKIWYELQVSSFPEFDFLKPYNKYEGFYRLSSLHLPYLGVNLNIILDDIEGLKRLTEQRSEHYYSKSRNWNIESGMLLIVPCYGISYHFTKKENRKLSSEIGLRTGFTHSNKDNMIFNSYTYYGLKYNWIESQKMIYNLNYGAELGGGIFVWDGFMPYPHLMAFLENEFTRFYFRVGAGTGFYGVIGYKLF